LPDNGAGARIQGRDNNPAKHLTDPKKCPNAPPEVRREARIFLAGKGVNNAFLDPITAVPTSLIDVPASNAVIAIKKRKASTIDGYVDHALTPAQQARANVKLFR
jgi:hypothetical protein